MAIVRWDPFGNQPFWGRRWREMWPDLWEDTDVTYNIPIEVKENKDTVVLKASVPGVDPKQLDIEVTEDSVSISYETQKEKEDKGERTYTCERMYGSFSRSVNLPTPIDTGKVEPQFNNGILTLKLTKRADLKPKKVKISLGKE